MGNGQNNSINVLLVDDEESFINIMKRRLEMRSLTVDAVLNGEEAIRYLSSKVPDVMLLDLRMPGMSGMEVLRATRDMLPGLPVIMLTGHGNSEDEAEARRLGCFAFLRKPADIHELLGKIRDACRPWPASF